ncbi:MAG: hypothetical protein V3T71_04615 [Dehalococcoidia bacterium]
MTPETVAEWYSDTKLIGYIVVFGIIGIPIYLSLLTSIFEPPRNFKVTRVFLGTVAVILVAFVMSFAVLGGVLGLFVP